MAEKKDTRGAPLGNKYAQIGSTPATGRLGMRVPVEVHQMAVDGGNKSGKGATQWVIAAIREKHQRESK